MIDNVFRSAGYEGRPASEEWSQGDSSKIQHCHWQVWRFDLFSELSRTYHHFHQILTKKDDGDCDLWPVAKDRGHHRSKVQNIFSSFFSDTFLNSDMRLQWLWLHLTGNLFDNIMTWGSSWCIFLAPSWMCGSSSTASLVLCSQELRNVIGSYLAQSSGGDVKECSLLRTKKGSCRQSLSTGRAQSRGGRLLLRWEGDVLNRDGQGLACWTIWQKYHLMILMTRHQGSDFPRGHHNQRHCPHPLQVSFCRFARDGSFFIW